MSFSAFSLDTPAAFGVARSFSGRRWVLAEGQSDAARAMARDAEIPRVLAKILGARAMTAADLAPTLKQSLPDPSVFKDMDEAVARVKAAIESDEKIAVFGDYDVDGSCSAALLHDVL